MLQDRTAVVTGAGRGIGREIARTLAGHGARVVLAARSRDQLEATRELITTDGGNAVVAIADVTVETDVNELEAFTRATYGVADILVCNSGVAGPSRPLWEITREEWEATMAVNVTGVFLCARAFLPAMTARRSGSVVVIGSMTGKRALVNRTPYATSKAGLIGLVRTLAFEAGAHNVRVNLVSPGAVEGERIDWVIEQQAQAQGIDVPTARAQFADASPLGRLVPAGDVAGTVAFLASDASASITGEDLNVSAGVAMF